jgi:hypothetical protein
VERQAEGGPCEQREYETQWHGCQQHVVPGQRTQSVERV